MIQFVPIPVKHLKIGDKVFHTMLRRCETVLEVLYNSEYCVITFKEDNRRDELKPDTTVLVAVNVNMVL